MPASIIPSLDLTAQIDRVLNRNIQFPLVTIGAGVFAPNDLNMTILGDATAGNVTINLPSAVGRKGMWFQIKRLDGSSNSFTILPQAGQTIDGAASLSLVTQGQAAFLASDGANWFVLAGVGGGGGPDIFAATRVVSPIPGEGTDTTIQDAFEKLPPEGGYVYVKGGTYAPATFPDKDVVLVGSGWGTKIAVSGTGACLTIPDGLTAVRRYTVENLTLEGTGAAQAGVSVEDTNARGELVLRGVKTENLRYPISVSAGDASNARPVLIRGEDCWFVPLAAGTSALCTSNGISETVFASFKRVIFAVNLNPFTGLGGTLNDNTFGNIDYEFEDSILALVGDDGYSSIQARNCVIFNASTIARIQIFLQGNFVVTNPATSVFEGCSLDGLELIAGDMLLMFGGVFRNGKIQISSSTGFYSDLEGVQFQVGGASPGDYEIVLDTPARISGCRFATTTAVLEGYIRITGGNCRIEGNVFLPLVSGGSGVAGIRVGDASGTGGRDNKIYGNHFAPSFNAPPILELASAANNKYVGNDGYANSSFQPTSEVEGSRRLEKTQTTTDSFAAVIEIRNPQGQNFLAALKNTGSNSVDVRETATDLYGVTDTKTTTVLPGGVLLLSGDQAVTTAVPPFRTYRVEVKSTVLGLPTTVDLRMTAMTPAEVI